MSKNLWQELLAYEIFPFEKSIPDDIRFRHSKNYIDFNHNICYALPFYQEAVDHERGLNKEYLKYMVQRENTILRLITGLEVYLVDTFKMISESITLDMLDRSELAYFVTEFRLEKEYFRTLKESIGAINLAKIIPKRLDIQQKDKCKKAYSLIGINVISVAEDSQLIWDRIFNSKDGYMQMRHEIVHRGTVQTYSVNINADYIKSAVIDIAKFIYNLDIKVISLYPKSDYPQFYIEKDSLLGVNI